MTLYDLLPKTFKKAKAELTNAIKTPSSRALTKAFQQIFDQARQESIEHSEVILKMLMKNSIIRNEIKKMYLELPVQDSTTKNGSKQMDSDSTNSLARHSFIVAILYAFACMIAVVIINNILTDIVSLFLLPDRLDDEKRTEIVLGFKIISKALLTEMVRNYLITKYHEGLAFSALDSIFNVIVYEVEHIVFVNFAQNTPIYVKVELLNTKNTAKFYKYFATTASIPLVNYKLQQVIMNRVGGTVGSVLAILSTSLLSALRYYINTKVATAVSNVKTVLRNKGYAKQ